MSELQQEHQNVIQQKISEQLSGVFEKVIRDKEEFYKNNKDKIPTKSNVHSLISACSYKNATITGALSLIPGPFGLVAAIPEICAIMWNQISMVYDIGIAYGHSKVLKKEVLMVIFATAMGNATGALAMMHGSKILIKRASLRVMQQMIKGLAGSVTQKLLKSMVAKWLPILGAVALATWTKFTTAHVGKKASELFEKEIEYDENIEITDIGDDSTIEDKITPESISIEKAKILCLISLIKVDGQIRNEEIEFVKPFIEGLDIPEAQRNELLNLALNKEKVSFNIDIFKNNHKEAIPLLVDMIALAKRNNEFHPTEQMYIKQIAKELNFSDEEIKDLM